MAEIQSSKPAMGTSPNVTATPSSKPPAKNVVRSRKPRPASLNQIYARPAPIQIFPFPTLTHNPVSLLHLIFTWLRQVWNPPPAVIHTGIWSPETSSIHVTDSRSMMELWQQGFYGKGDLSRSEPNWLKKEQIRVGMIKGKVSEKATARRREERTQAKWERARAEQEAIERTRLAEAAPPPTETGLITPPPSPPKTVFLAPVGPLQLLNLPNSEDDLLLVSSRVKDSTTNTTSGGSGDTSADGSGSSGNDDNDTNTTISEPGSLKRQKSVRFSENVESTTFQHTDPPSPSPSLRKPAPSSVVGGLAHENALALPPSVDEPVATPSSVPDTVSDRAVALQSESPIVNKEHLQLTSEEAFFLVFGLGVLRVVDPCTQKVIPVRDLLVLLRQHSYFPPKSSLQALQPDDPFLVHYAVYHHFRSLGWTLRPGLKFGVDWLLYRRGPVFDHAEFGILVVPSYEDPGWSEGARGRAGTRRTWHSFMGVNRVLSTVWKSLLLVYVAVPPSAAFGADGEPVGGVAGLLERYTVRYGMVKRWSSNRNRN